MKNASSTTNLIALFTIAGAVAAGFATGPAFAQTSSHKDSGDFEFVFNYKPSELQSAPSAEKLLARLETQVRNVCTPEGRLTVDQHLQARACVKETMERTVPKFTSTAVAQAYDLRAGG